MTFRTYIRHPALVIIGISLISCGQEPEPETMLRPVRFQKVFATGGARVRAFSGVAQAGLESRLSFKVAGTVSSIDVKVGDEVKVGDLIAKLDASDYQLQVQQAEASLQSAKAQERNASADYDRVKRLWENRTASRNDLDAARAAYESAGAQVKALENQLSLAQSQLGYTRLKAPAAGAIAAVHVEVNENVQAGQTIVELSSGSQLEVEVGVPEVLISDLREGQAVTVRFDAIPDKIFPARITEVGVSATDYATTYPVTVLLDKADPACRPGMAAEVEFRFDTGSTSDRIMVPSVAVGEDRQGRFVFVVEPTENEGEGVVHRRAVTTGQFTDEGIEVLEGLIDGSRVVTAGVSKLVDGQTVKFSGSEENLP